MQTYVEVEVGVMGKNIPNEIDLDRSKSHRYVSGIGQEVTVS